MNFRRYKIFLSRFVYELSITNFSTILDSHAGNFTARLDRLPTKLCAIVSIKVLILHEQYKPARLKGRAKSAKSNWLSISTNRFFLADIKKDVNKFYHYCTSVCIVQGINRLYILHGRDFFHNVNSQQTWEK